MYKLIATEKSDLFKEIADALYHVGYVFEYVNYSMGEIKPVYTRGPEEADVVYDKIYVFWSLHNTSNVNVELEKLILSLNALKSVEKDSEIILIAPFLPYARQDKVAEGESSSFQIMLEQIKAAGISYILTWDLHNQKFVGNEPEIIPPLTIYDIYTPKSICNKIVEYLNDISVKKNVILNNVLLIAPDQGAANMVTGIKEQLDTLFDNKLNIETAVCTKTRLPDRSVQTKTPEYNSTPTSVAIMCDDIIDTGNTMLGILARFSGFLDKVIMVSHGILNTSNQYLIGITKYSDSLSVTVPSAVLAVTGSACPKDFSYSLVTDFADKIREDNADMPDLS